MASKKREFLQLANQFNPAKHDISGWFLSEKLDGTRCFWDGGLSRGVSTASVPWANVRDPKTGEMKAKVKPIATGLWSRYGNPIMAPDDFLNSLPTCFLDGELWAGRGQFQRCRSICAGDTPDPRFNEIRYVVYGSPSIDAVFQSGEFTGSNWKGEIDLDACKAFVQKRIRAIPGYSEAFFAVPRASTFADELLLLRGWIETQSDTCYLHKQVQLPEGRDAAEKKCQQILDELLSVGAEGVVLRDPTSQWVPKRHNGMLKYKPYEDTEVVVLGYVAGREGKQGNLLGKIGALIVLWGDKEFEVGSGFTFEEREFATDAAREYATAHPGQRLPPEFMGKHFRPADILTIKYRELTDDGIPKEARYWRVRGEE